MKFQTFSWIFAKHALGMLKGYRLLVVLFSVKIPRVIPASSQAMKGLFLGDRCFTAGVSLCVARFLGNFEKKNRLLIV